MQMAVKFQNILVVMHINNIKLVVMKILIVFIFCFFGLETLNAHNLIVAPSPTEFTLENLNPFGARDLNDLSSSFQYFDLIAKEIPCPFGVTRLYYHFRANETNASLPLGSVSTNVDTTYFKVYGPFNSIEEGATQISSNSAFEISVGGPTTPLSISVESEENKVYIIELILNSCSGEINFTLNSSYTRKTPSLVCQDCIPSFNPGAGKYVLSAWVKEEGATLTKKSYSFPSIEISFPSIMTTHDFTPSGQIIDGWQKIDTIFEIPSGASDFVLKLKVSSGNAFFDDIRIFPYDGSMISYVYDPINLRLVAELDERNYAKIYEYDEEGKLIRIKKETEKGIMTIQENRESSVKKP